MRKHLGSFALFLALTTTVCVRGLAVQSPVVRDPWQRLRSKTAWLLLGNVKRDTEEWVTTIPFVIDGAKPGDREKVPVVGDRIRLVVRTPLVIVDFRHRGEDLRLESPAAREVTADDLAGPYLNAGDVVEVKDVSRKRLLYVDDIAVRVAPVTNSARP